MHDIYMSEPWKHAKGKKKDINTYVPSDTRNAVNRRNYRGQHYMTAWLLREERRAAGREKSCRERDFLYAVTKKRF